MDQKQVKINALVKQSLETSSIFKNNLDQTKKDIDEFLKNPNLNLHDLEEKSKKYLLSLKNPIAPEFNEFLYHARLTRLFIEITHILKT
jgi:hypothetical protein